MNPAPISDPTLKLMVDRIVHNHHPEKIILFGSRARGDAKPGSDYDLLIVADVSGNPRQFRREIYHSLYELRLPVGKDIVVATPEDIQRTSGLMGSILTPAIHEGQLLYDRAA
jgi:predicted nucleotidyltransferase